MIRSLVTKSKSKRIETKHLKSRKIATKPRHKRKHTTTPKIHLSLQSSRQSVLSHSSEIHPEHHISAKSPAPHLAKFFANYAKKAPIRNATKVPVDYKPIDPVATALQRQKELDAQQGPITSPGDYTIYKSKYQNMPLYSLSFVLFAAASNYSMFAIWAEQKLWGLPPEALYGIGIGCLVGLSIAQMQFSQRWVKSITCKIENTNKLPGIVKITTGNLIGFSKTMELPLSVFRGLVASDRLSEANMKKPLFTVEIATKKKFLLLWRSKGDFANPSGALERILGTQDVGQIVTSRGHTYGGKLYSDADYDAVMEKIKQSRMNDMVMLPSQIEHELQKSADDSLTWETSRKLGILTRAQEMDELVAANKKYVKLSDLYKERSDADMRYDTKRVQSLDLEISHLLAEASTHSQSALNSMLHKAQFVYNPEIDFDGFTKEATMQLFRDVLKTQKTSRHPRTNTVKFVFGKGAEVNDQLQTMAQMYLKSNPIRHQWGEKDTENEGTLLVSFKTKEKDDIHSDVNKFFEENQKETKDYLVRHKKGTFTM